MCDKNAQTHARAHTFTIYTYFNQDGGDFNTVSPMLYCTVISNRAYNWSFVSNINSISTKVINGRKKKLNPHVNE